VKKVQEFCFEPTDKIDVTLPRHSKLLSVQQFDQKLYLWVVVDDSETVTDVRHLRVFKNDCEIDEEEYWDMRYICTIQDNVTWKDPRTLHIFEYEEYDRNKIYHP
jgi:hypothetical protein